MHPEIAFGIHPTVVTDFDDYRWRPLAPRDRVSSLLDETDYFHRDEPRQAYLARLTYDALNMRDNSTWMTSFG